MCTSDGEYHSSDIMHTSVRQLLSKYPAKGRVGLHICSRSENIIIIRSRYYGNTRFKRTCGALESSSMLCTLMFIHVSCSRRPLICSVVNPASSYTRSA